MRTLSRSSSKFLLFTIFVLGLLSRCAAEPDARGGLCALSCDGAVIGSSNFKIEAQNADGAIQCSGTFTDTQRLPGPTLVQFLIFKEIPADTADGTPTRIPIPNISIEPLISGVMDNDATNPELRDGDGAAAFRYAGVVTRSSEWCADACGVVSLEVQPLCVANSTNQVSVQVHSGGAFSTPAKITVRHGVGP